MCSKNKSIIAILCTMLVIAGISASAITPAQATTTTTTNTATSATSSTLSLEQLQQIINSLKQQIQQLIVLVQQKIQVLQQANTTIPSSSNQQGATQSCDQVCKAQGYTGGTCRSWSLGNPAAQYCADMGYTSKIITNNDGSQSGICVFNNNDQCEEWAFYRGTCGKNYVKSNYISSIGCLSGETPIKNSSCSMNAGLVGGDRACCCAGTPSTTVKNQCTTDSDCLLSCSMGCVNKTWYQTQNKVDCMALPVGITCSCNNGNCEKKAISTKCVPEGKTVSISDQQYSGCCAGLQQNWLNVAPTTPQYNCTNCGNGKCDYGETNTNCPKDCYCGDGRCDAGETDVSCAKDCANQCKKAGEQTNGLTASCCSGLTAASNCLKPDSNGNCQSLVGCGGATCIKCGDGICGDGENKCNCPADCEKNKCVPEGKTVSISDQQYSGCCAGLQQNWLNVAPTTPQYNCTNCGNGKCDYGETNTNCPKDCYCGDGRCDAGETDVSCAKDCANQCKKAGEQTNGLTASCCSGLTAASNCLKPDSNGNCQSLVGCGGATCIKCGDGICGDGENKCNCPKDCGSVTQSPKCNSTLTDDTCKAAGGNPMHIATCSNSGCTTSSYCQCPNTTGL